MFCWSSLHRAILPVDLYMIPGWHPSQQSQILVVVKNFHTEAYPPEKALMCSLRILGGEGDKNDCADITEASCTEIGTAKVPDDHKFGSYYGRTMNQYVAA
jgi:hypothetical protein